MTVEVKEKHTVEVDLGVETEHPPGTIGISGGEMWRHGASFMALTGCWKPPGTRIMLSQSISIPENLNEIIRQMTGDWLWIQADDHRWGGMALKQLLDREVDIVVPLILRRGPPFVPVVFKERTEKGYLPFSYDELPAEGLVEVRMAGTGGMLIRKHVLDTIGDPWFTYGGNDNLNEDFLFVERAREAGFTVHCDVEVVMGHIGTFTIWPHRNAEGRWIIGFDMGSGKDGKNSTFFFDPHDEVGRREE